MKLTDKNNQKTTTKEKQQKVIKSNQTLFVEPLFEQNLQQNFLQFFIYCRTRSFAAKKPQNMFFVISKFMSRKLNKK